ncbi:hypothetical protein [Phaffia rhodozyma]|uniref:Uncharacterized protein n=1 Tax=Phaffia rhodozyma TaxID=264483 RepID=A0A0F7SLH8_PHARH|nr:hypothetical protein [Phaffia rhodozyma]
MNVPLPILPPRDYPVTRFASSPLPRFLRTVTFLLSLLLGSSAIAAYLYTKIILPRLIRSREARDILLQKHVSHLDSLRISLNRYLDVGFVRNSPSNALPTDNLLIEGSQNEIEASLAADSLTQPLVSSVKEAETEIAPSDTLTIEASSGKDESSLIRADSVLGLSVEKDPVGLPMDDLGDLYALLLMLAPKERPTGLLRAIKGAGASIVSQSLLFNSKTTRVSSNGSYSLSNQLERAGAVGSGGAWGGGLGPGEREVISLIGGLRGDVRGFKGALLSRRALSNP